MRELTPGALAARFPALFGGLPAESLERVIEALQPLSYEDSATVLGRGEHSDALYLVWAGRLSVVLHVRAELLTLAERKEGDWVGELSLLDPDTVTADVVSTTTTTTLLRLSADDFEQLRVSDPRAGRAILHGLVRDLAGRIRNSQEQAWRHEEGRWVLEGAMAEDRGQGWLGRLWTRMLGGEG